jgi:hypothetical protein
MASRGNSPRTTTPVEGAPLPVGGTPARGPLARAASAGRGTTPPPDLDERERRQSAQRRSVGARSNRGGDDDAADDDDTSPPVQPTDPS